MENGAAADGNDDDDEDDDEKPLDLSWPKTFREQVIYVFIAPLVFSLWLTLVDVRREVRPRHRYA